MDVEYKYSPLDGDSDRDEPSTQTSDESIALLAHEILCCEHDSDTEAETDTNDVNASDASDAADGNGDVNVDVDVDNDDDEDNAEAEHNYALLMCSEEDEDFALYEEQQHREQQRLAGRELHPKQLAARNDSKLKPQQHQHPD